MEDDRRKHLRESVSCDSSIKFDGRDYNCVIQNISAGGALLRIEAGQLAEIEMNCLGGEVILNNNSGDPFTVRGRIIRVNELDGSKYLAVFFLDSKRSP